MQLGNIFIFQTYNCKKHYTVHYTNQSSKNCVKIILCSTLCSSLVKKLKKNKSAKMKVNCLHNYLTNIQHMLHFLPNLLNQLVISKIRNLWFHVMLADLNKNYMRLKILCITNELSVPQMTWLLKVGLHFTHAKKKHQRQLSLLCQRLHFRAYN